MSELDEQADGIPTSDPEDPKTGAELRRLTLKASSFPGLAALIAGVPAMAYILGYAQQAGRAAAYRLPRTIIDVDLNGVLQAVGFASVGIGVLFIIIDQVVGRSTWRPLSTGARRFWTSGFPLLYCASVIMVAHRSAWRHGLAISSPLLLMVILPYVLPLFDRSAGRTMKERLKVWADELERTDGVADVLGRSFGFGAIVILGTFLLTLMATYGAAEGIELSRRDFLVVTQDSSWILLGQWGENTVLGRRAESGRLAPTIRILDRSALSALALEYRAIGPLHIDPGADSLGAGQPTIDAPRRDSVPTLRPTKPGATPDSTVVR